MIFGSLFTGIGGFDLSFIRANMTCAWMCEIDPTCQTVLRRQFPATPLHGDIHHVGAHNLAPVDVVCFGSPCQDLSIAGRRDGLNGARSSLFYEAIRVIRECRPALAVWENVPGALSSHAGRDFTAVLRAFRELGARDIAWRTLNAEYFGVAQRRRRVFLVADFGGERAAEILFESEGVRGDFATGRAAGQGIAGDVAPCLRANGGIGGRCDRHPLTLARSQTTREGLRNEPTAETYIVSPTLRAGANRTGGDRPPGTDVDTVESLVVTHALTANGFDASEDGTGRGTPIIPTVAATIGQRMRGQDDSCANNLVPVAMAFTERTRKDGRNLEAQDGLAYCLTNPGSGGRTHSRQLLHGTAVRRLTPRECERLQGFPDDWTAYRDDGEPIADGPRYRMLGNAVAVPVAAWLGERIVTALLGA